MRILLSCLQSPARHPIPAYDFWRGYFTKGCEEAGIEYLEVPGVDWAAGLVFPLGPTLEEWKSKVWSSTIEFLEKEHQRSPVDAFLGYLYPSQIEASAIQRIRGLGIPCVNFFCDNVREFARVPAEFKDFDLHWVPEFEAVPMYQAAGLAYLHAPMPCWVPVRLRTVPEIETEEPTFIGSADVLRRDLIARAIDEGADLVVRGPGWVGGGPGQSSVPVATSASKTFSNQLTLLREKGAGALVRKVLDRLLPLPERSISSGRVKPAVWGEEYTRVLREAAVTLGINRVPSWKATVRRPLSYSRLRDLEAPMVGACYLTEWTAGLEHLFEVGEEIETYRSPAEMAEKLLELLGNPARRREMRHKAQRRALSDHSVPRSLDKVFRHLGIGAVQ